MLLEYLQESGSRCCYDYSVDMQLQNCTLCPAGSQMCGAWRMSHRKRVPMRWWPGKILLASITLIMMFNLLNHLTWWLFVCSLLNIHLMNVILFLVLSTVSIGLIYRHTKVTSNFWRNSILPLKKQKDLAKNRWVMDILLMSQKQFVSWW